MKPSLLITGGAGFIGSNLTKYFSEKGYIVTIFDNLERVGARENLAWLEKTCPLLNVVVGDVRKSSQVKDAVKGKDLIFHLAGQVAVTTSVKQPRMDFEANALGTLNVLEAVRTQRQKSIVIYASTNKVYGDIEGIKVLPQKTRYTYKDLKNGIPESTCLDFHSPYGCSKGVGDQYVRDYERIYNIPTVVFRQSCIYGPRQFGVEDQGWVAWFMIALTKGKSIRIYGDGRQVRDILYIDDLVHAYEGAVENISKTRGQIYNIGGGNKNTISVWAELRPYLERLFNKQIRPKFSDWRPGDQKIYISDIRKAGSDMKWAPKIPLDIGIPKLFDWIRENRTLFKSVQ